MKKTNEPPLSPPSDDADPRTPAHGMRLDLGLVDRRVALRTWLIYHGITEKEIAVRLKISASTVTRVLSGQRRSSALLARLTELGIPASLLGDDE